MRKSGRSTRGRPKETTKVEPQLEKKQQKNEFMDLQFVTREYLKLATTGKENDFKYKPFKSFLYSVDPISITDLCVYYNVAMDQEMLGVIKKHVKRGKIDCNKKVHQIQINKWHFQSGLKPGTHVLEFNLVVDDCELLLQDSAKIGQHKQGAIGNIFDQVDIYRDLEVLRRVNIQAWVQKNQSNVNNMILPDMKPFIQRPFQFKRLESDYYDYGMEQEYGYQPLQRYRYSEQRTYGY